MILNTLKWQYQIYDKDHMVPLWLSSIKHSPLTSTFYVWNFHLINMEIPFFSKFSFTSYELWLRTDFRLILSLQNLHLKSHTLKKLSYKSLSQTSISWHLTESHYIILSESLVTQLGHWNFTQIHYQAIWFGRVISTP